jgi:hypothetical protein
MATVARTVRPILTRSASPFEELPPAPSAEPAPVEEPMIYRGTPFHLAHDRAETRPSDPVAMTYRGTTFTAPSSPTHFPFGRRGNLRGMIYRGTRIEG